MDRCAKPWTPNELVFLKRWYGIRRAAWIGGKLERSRASVTSKAAEIGLKSPLRKRSYELKYKGDEFYARILQDYTCMTTAAIAYKYGAAAPKTAESWVRRAQKYARERNIPALTEERPDGRDLPPARRSV